MINKHEKVLVTQPSLPPLDEFIEYLKDIWDSKWLTNNGTYHKQLEAALADYLGVKYISLFANGTLALITAMQVLKISGEVITTPYTFVATTHAMKWNGIEPVFVDVDPVYGNLDPDKIEASITPHTTAILPVHVYGNPANVQLIEEIAHQYGLKVIYDAAHAFGVNIGGESLLNYGDLSILSFHATKVFNTIEGGAIICHDKETKQHIDYLKNFGFANETTVIAAGINAKMNEVQAAYGLLQLKYINGNVKARKAITEQYNHELGSIDGIRLLPKQAGNDYSYSYYPIFVNEIRYGKTRDELYYHLKDNNIYGRRYFYPLVSEFPMYNSLDSAEKNNLQIAHELAGQVICLPIYPDLKSSKVSEIASFIRRYKV